jgi:uncharacterized protein
MPNPFKIKVIKNEKEFCDRQDEQQKLISYINNKTNVVLYAPRRFGKTSLVKRVHNKLSKEDIILIYVDFFGITSHEDIAKRTAKSIYSAIHQTESIFQKALNIFRSFRPVVRPSESGISISVEQTIPNISGIDLLSKTLEDLGKFIEKSSEIVNVVFDEFQEITRLKNTQTEGILRSHIQEHDCSYFFLGSRRSILLQMFNDKKRPFYQSAFMYELKALPDEELAQFIQKQFSRSNKLCSIKLARQIVDMTHQHPYYSQKLAYCVHESSGKKIAENDLKIGLNELIASETALFEILLQGLAPQQIALLKAIATQPSRSVLSSDYMKRHNLKSIGGIQGAIKKLSDLDIIEKRNNAWTVVDPILAVWL